MEGKILVLDRNTWNFIKVCKLFVLRIVILSYNCSERIIIISYLKIYDCLKYLKPFVCKLLISNKNTWNHHPHHDVVPLAWISLTLTRHFSLSFIASGRSSGPHPVSSHSSWMYVRAGRPAFAQPYVGVHRSTSLMSLSLLLQQCPGSSNLDSFRDGMQVAVNSPNILSWE